MIPLVILENDLKIHVFFESVASATASRFKDQAQVYVNSVKENWTYGMIIILTILVLALIKIEIKRNISQITRELFNILFFLKGQCISFLLLWQSNKKLTVGTLFIVSALVYCSMVYHFSLTRFLYSKTTVTFLKYLFLTSSKYTLITPIGYFLTRGFNT